MHSLLLDIAVALRFFSRRRAAFAVIVATMALALGANTAVFSVLKAFLFADLGIPNSDRVMFVWTTRELPGRGRVDFTDSYPNYRLLRATTHYWESLACVQAADVNWQQDADTRQLQAARVTTDFFAVMGVRPVLGRIFTEKEQGPNAAPVAIISDRLWRSEFGGSPDVLGHTLRVNGLSLAIVGVLPRRFSQPQGTDLWLPFDLPAEQWSAITGARQLSLYARLAPGLTVAAADAELRAFAKRAVEADGQNKDWGWRVQPVRESLLSGADRALVFVQVGAGVLLLLAITNLSSLLVAWAAERQRETAVRLALGAPGWRLARQFLVQGLVLVALGGILGVLLTHWSLPVLQKFNPNPQLGAFLEHLEVDGGTLGFAAALVFGTGLLAGLLPAWLAQGTSVNEALRSSSRGASLSRGAIRWQQSTVIAQAAISVLILVSAGLAAVGFQRLSRLDLGIATESRAAFRLQFPEPAYASAEKRVQVVRELEQSLAAEPALLGAGFTTTLPVGDQQWGGAFLPQLATGEYVVDPEIAHFRRVSPGYLRAVGIPLLEGREIDEHDEAGGRPVAVVSRALAEKFWPGTTAIGRKLKRVNNPTGTPIEIVGVVGNVLDAGAGAPLGETVYVPFAQMTLRRGWLVLWARGSPEDAIAAGRRALHATAPGVAAFDLATLDDLAWQANALPRLLMVLLGVFAAIAIGITALGSYGVMSQLVSNREQELAIRAALGATRSGVLRLVLWQNARLALLGVLVGLAGSWFAAHWVASLVPGFSAAVFWPYVAVALGVLGLTQLASLLPAHRASRLEVQRVLAGG